jgi:hypothetical protein
LWQIVRHWQPEGESTTIDQNMNVIREPLGDQNEALEEDERNDWDVDEAVANVVKSHLDDIKEEHRENEDSGMPDIVPPETIVETTRQAQSQLKHKRQTALLTSK